MSTSSATAVPPRIKFETFVNAHAGKEYMAMALEHFNFDIVDIDAVKSYNEDSE